MTLFPLSPQSCVKSLTPFLPIHKSPAGCNIAVICLVVALCAALVGCSSSGDSISSMALENMPPGDEMTPEEPDTEGQMPAAWLPTDPQAVAAAAGRIQDTTSLSVESEDGEPITGYLNNFLFRGLYASMSQSYRDGSRAFVLPWYNEEGELEVYGGVWRSNYSHSDPYVTFGREVHTDGRDVEGVTRSHRAVENHGLGSEWQGFEAITAYEAAGKLTLRLFTDLQESDNPGDPSGFAGNLYRDTSYHDIALTDSRIAAIPADQDGIFVIVPEEGLGGSLDDMPGTFTCATGTSGYCALQVSRYQFAPGYIPDNLGDPVRFTPDDGSGAVELAGYWPVSVAATDYLNFGFWLFVPEDVTAASDFDFGVFAGGGDPFQVNNLQGLAGTAEYEGEAAGMYSETTMISPFNAKVELTADFGTADDFGAIGGRVYDFNIDGGKTLPLTELSLGPILGRKNNIYLSWNHAWLQEEWVSWAGGWIEGETSADGEWQGRWGGLFFGNGGAATDHPTSFAGTFGATKGDQSVAGSFGAER